MFSISPFFRWNNYSSAFFEFSSVTSFGFTILSAILFPINPSVASAVLWTTFFELVFKASSHAAVSNNCFTYLLDKFLANDKNPYR